MKDRDRLIDLSMIGVLLALSAGACSIIALGAGI
jgi:hypothetical protein